MDKARELKLRISAEADKNKTLPELRQSLRGVVEEMNRAKSEGQQGSEQWNMLKDRAGQLSREIKGLSREYRGLEADVKRSKYQIMEHLENVTIGIMGFQKFAGEIKEAGKEMVETGLEQKEFSDHFKGTAKDMEDLRRVTGNSMKDIDLYRYANKNLGLSLEQEKILFGLARLSVQEHGGTMEEAFQKEQLVTEGKLKGLQSLNIETARYRSVLQDSVQTLGGSIEIEKDENGEIIENIKNLEPATQKRLRYEAMIKASGKSLEELINVEQTDKEKLDAIGVAVDNAKAKIGIFIGEGLVKLIEKFGVTNEAGNKTVGMIGAIGGSVTTVLPLLAELKEIAPKTFALIGSSAGMASLYVAGVVAAIYALYQAYKTFKEINTGTSSTTPQQIQGDITKQKEADRIQDLMRKGQFDDKVITSLNEQEINVLAQKVGMEKKLTGETEKQVKGTKSLLDLRSEYDKAKVKYDHAPDGSKEKLDFMKEMQRLDKEIYANDPYAKSLGTGKGKKDKVDKTDEQDLELNYIKLQVDLAKENKSINADLLQQAIDQVKVKRDALQTDYEAAKLAGDKKEEMRIGTDLLNQTRAIHDFEKDIDDIWTKQMVSRREILQEERDGHLAILKYRIDYSNRIIALDNRISKNKVDLIQFELEKQKERIQQRYDAEIDALNKQQLEQARDVDIKGTVIKINTPEEIDKFNQLRELANLVMQSELTKIDPMLTALNAVIETTIQSTSQLFQSFTSGDPNAFKAFMKSIAVSAISAAEIIIFAMKGISLAQAIANPFTLIKNVPLLALALLALEAAKGAISGLNQGGDVGPGTYLVGDAPGGHITPYTEMLNVPAGSKASVYPNRTLQSFVAANIASQSANVNVDNYWRIDMNKGEAYLEGKFDGGNYIKARKL